MEIEVSLFKRRSSWTTADGKGKTSWSWWARWFVRENGLDGVERKRDRQRSLKTKDRREAEKMRQELEAALNVPAPASAGPVVTMHWEKAMELYTHYHLCELSRNTQINTKMAWRRFWGWIESQADGHPGVAHLEQLQPRMILDWRKDEGMAAKTKNTYLNRCKSCIARLQELKLYSGPNAFADVRPMGEPKTEKVWLTSEETFAFVQAARECSVDLYLFVALGFYAGLRGPSEILGVRWDWIHWADSDATTGYIRIPESDERWRVKDKEARSIPLFPALASILREHRGVPRAYVVNPFATEWSGAYRWMGVRAAFGAISGVIPDKRVTIYTMRRTFASELVRRGVDLYKAMQWMGHSDIKVFQEYAHLAPADNDIRRLFPDALSGV